MPPSKRTIFERHEAIERNRLDKRLTNDELFEECKKLFSQYEENDWIIAQNGIFRKTKAEPAHRWKDDLTDLRDKIPLIRKCMGIIPLLVTTTKTKALVHSYSLKHRLEGTMTEVYVSNGEAIIAMLLLGHRISLPEPSRKGTINCDFFCKYVASDYMTDRPNITCGINVCNHLLFRV